MKKFLAVAVLSVGLVALADIGFFFPTANLKADSMHINRLPDGGASVQADCSATSADGGYTLNESSFVIELSGANQTTALNILNGPGLNACKSRRPGF